MLWLKESTAVTVMIGPFVDDTDGKTAETGLTITQADVRLSKNGGAFAQKNEVTSASHGENGYYTVDLDTTDTGTLGRLILAVSETGALPIRVEFMVVASETYDALVSGPTNYLSVNTVQIEGSDATDQINASCDTALTDYDAPTKAEMDSAFTEIKGATWASATDTLEAIRDRGDAAWITATGFSTHSAADVWAHGTRVLTANTNLNDPTAAAIADAVWDEASAGHTDAGKAGAQLWTDIDAILTDTAEIGAAGAGLTAVPWNAAWDAEVQSECTDALNSYDPPTKAEMDSGFAALNDPTAAAIADAVWDEAAGDHTAAGSFGEQAGTDIDAILDDTGTSGVALAGTPGVNVTQISGSSDAADNLEKSALAIVVFTVNDATPATTGFITNLTEATNDHYNGRYIVGAGSGEACFGQLTKITNYDGGTKTITVTAMTNAPANGDTFVML